MSAPLSFRQTLCLKYCAYFKPGKNEELACRGYLVVEQLIRSGKARIPDAFTKEPDRSTAETVIQKICVNCDFFEKDCDFMQDRAAPPCGGMVVLTQLLKTNRASLEDIVTTNRTCGKGARKKKTA
jgi:hypothetical protein